MAHLPQSLAHAYRGDNGSFDACENVTRNEFTYYLTVNFRLPIVFDRENGFSILELNSFGESWSTANKIHVFEIHLEEYDLANAKI